MTKINSDNKDKNKKFSINNINKRLIIVMLLVIVTVLSSTFAWFTYSSKKSALVLTIGDMDDARIVLSPYQITGSMEPVSIYTDVEYTQVEAINNATNSVVMSLYYKINNLPRVLIENGLKYTIATSSTKNGTYIHLKTGDFTGTVVNDEIFNKVIPEETTEYYRIYLWLDSSVGDQSLIQGQSLNVELNGRIESNGTKPVVNTGMIPVTIDNNGDVYTIDQNDPDWYNYSEQRWANMVLVNDSSRSSYVNTDGEYVEESDILAYYVWIPRYKYKISREINCSEIGPSNDNFYSGCYSYEINSIGSDPGTIEYVEYMFIEIYEEMFSCSELADGPYSASEILDMGYVYCDNHGKNVSVSELIDTYSSFYDNDDMVDYNMTFHPERTITIGTDTYPEAPISIVFEDRDDSEATYGDAKNTYYTHPAFTFGDEEVNGIWVGKFETTGNETTPTVLPNDNSLINQTVSTQFSISRKFSTYGNSYGLSSDTDSHMAKNSEWGAVAYLSHSKYGINSEIYINNSSGYFTGRSGGNVSGSVATVATQFSGEISTMQYNSYGYYTWTGQTISSDGIVGDYADDRTLGTNASSTGNVTGVYDLSGGAEEYVMGNYNDTIQNSGFSIFPESKYYDKYTTTSSTSACNRGICFGHALSETSGWYDDFAYFVAPHMSWLLRGGGIYAGSDAGAFYSSYDDGGDGAYASWRSVLVPVEVTDALNGNVPELEEGMIPVTIAADGTVKTVEPSFPKWYDYENKIWANMVLVDSSNRSTYANNYGVTVDEDDILAYYVWIPRFKFQIMNMVTSTNSWYSPETINIIFENKNTPKSTGTTVGSYRTHPAFTFGTTELNGIWVGKFESSLGSDNDEVRIIPNVEPEVGFGSISTMFIRSLTIANGEFNNGLISFSNGGMYGLTVDTDSHMMKNSEWGAVAYLSHSVYGINDEMATTLSGITGSEPDADYGDAFADYTTSTTKNITGIYDMSGNYWEYVMGNHKNNIKNSGFDILPPSKYYDLYTNDSYEKFYEACNGNQCYGHALFDTNNWYDDNQEFVVWSDYPWFARGGDYDSDSAAGIFAYYSDRGGNYSDDLGDYDYTWRSVLVSASDIVDDTSPIVALSSNGSSSYSTGTTLTVTINDSDSGVAAGQSIKYLWQTSASCPTSAGSYTKTAVLSNTSVLSGTATATVSASGLNGTYYLCIYGGIRDVEGNVTAITRSTGTYLFDNSAPSCSLSVSSSGITFASKTDNIGVTGYGMGTTSTPNYNSGSSLALSAGSKYGFVKDAAGNVAQCSKTITQATTNKTTGTINCSSSNYSNRTTTACSSAGYTGYNGSNSCSQAQLYKGTTYTCKATTTSSFRCFCTDIDGLVYEINATNLSSCSTTCGRTGGTVNIANTGMQSNTTYAWVVATTFSGLDSRYCTTWNVSNCDANYFNTYTEAQRNTYRRRDCTASGYSYSGTISCYNSSTSCSSGSLISGTSFCTN